LEGPPERLVPFTSAAVPVVDLAARRIVVALPEEVVVPPQPNGQPDGEDAG
jgi:16S rRNA processing protein RimM